MSLAYGAQGTLYRSIVPEGATAAAKGIDATWLASLRLREPSEPTFTKAANQLRYIGMPVGGIACGTLYLGGDGRLWLWDVWHKNGEGIRPRSRYYTHPNAGNSGNRSCTDGTNYFAPINVWNANPPVDEKPFPFDQGFVLRTVANTVVSVKTLDQRGFSGISFRGSYPLARVSYTDATSPLTVELCAHPIFIPLNTPDSALPATVMEYTLTNNSAVSVDATVLGYMQNPVLLDTGLPAGMSRGNQIRNGSGCAFLECRADGSAVQPFTYAADYDVFASFEGTTYAPWIVTGTAFGSGPVVVPPINHQYADLQDVRGVGSKFVNTWLASGGDGATGSLTSPAFTIGKNYIHFLMGGGAVSGIQVRLVDANTNAQLMIATNTVNASTMKWRIWDVTALAGRSVKIVVEDNSNGSWGQLGFDHVCFSDKPQAPEYVVYDDFERATYAPWVTTGTAFGSGPILIADIAAYQGDVKGFGTRVVNSHASAPGVPTDGKDVPTGTLVSPAFTVTHGYIHFLQGGGSNSALERVRLLKASDSSQLRIQSGNDTSTMAWRTFDVRDLRGQTVQLSVEDLSSGGWGNVGIDQILFSTNPVAPSAAADLITVVDRGTIGIAELGAAAGRISAADNLSTALPWLTGKSADTGGIGRTLTLAPGAVATVRFVVAWHFPNFPSGLPGTRREYLNRFVDAFAVADYVSSNFTRLAGDTRLWVDTWKDSSLPHWLLDRALATSCTLATANCFWFTTGRFYATEGVGAGDGTCGHVWYYAQTVARLFPDLERGLRQTVDLNPAVALNSDGSVKFRGEYNGDWAWDGQCGVVLRCYREHLGSANSTFLTANWANIKKALDFLIAQDANNDGVSEARQHNTLDADWYGRVPEHIGLYAAALKAGREMATVVGNSTYAASCNTLATAAMARLAERFVSTSGYGEGYYTQLMASDIGALGHAEGCYIDQVMGEFYTRMIGLERVTDLTQCRAALRSIWRFNYSHNLTNFLSSGALTQGRIYQAAGEAGLLICTFPNDGNLWPDPAVNWQGKYFAECMTGFEYQVGVHCLAEGLLDEGLTIIRAVHDRYHPSKRNPYNEIEYSDHYARAMSSYGALITASGFRHSGPDGMLGFAPVLNAEAFKSAFTAAQGWGSYQRSKQGQKVMETITLKRGSLRLRKFECALPANTIGYLAQAKRNGTTIAASFTLTGSTLRCTLPADLNLVVDDTFQIIHFTSLLAANTDADADGLTDLEEVSGIDDPATVIDPRGRVTSPASTDTDGDGTKDGVEARLNTNPLDGGDYFQPLITRSVLGEPTLTWPSATGTSFTIERSTSLLGWAQIATNLTGQSGHTSYTDTAAPATAHLFYRVRLD